MDYEDGMREEFKKQEKILEKMEEEEKEKREEMIERNKERFGERIKMIRRENVSGYYDRKKEWMVSKIGIEKVSEEE